jgi:hypothetical protein
MGKADFYGNAPRKISAQHAEFLRQLDEGSSDYCDAIHWFQQLPVWMEFPGLRVVHACAFSEADFRTSLPADGFHNPLATHYGIRALGLAHPG